MEVAQESRRDVPFVVMLASFFGFAKAVFLGFIGVVGVASWDDVSDPWGYGSLVMAALFAIASWLLLRGSRAARNVLGALAVIGGVLAAVYVFTGPASAVVPSLVTVAMAAALLYLLYLPRASKEYFGS